MDGRGHAEFEIQAGRTRERRLRELAELQRRTAEASAIRAHRPPRHLGLLLLSPLRNARARLRTSAAELEQQATG